MKESNTLATSSRSDRLGSYLATAVGVSALAATSDAAIVNLDISAITGARSSSDGGFETFEIIAGNYSTAVFVSSRSYYLGLGTSFQLDVDLAMNGDNYGLYQFPSGAYIGSGLNWASKFNTTSFFLYGSWNTPAWGSGSFIGFRLDGGTPLYGWLEVTWNGTDTFEILGGAYEDSGAPIAAGAVAPVPEPAGALGTLGLLSAGMFLRRRQRAA